MLIQQHGQDGNQHALHHVQRCDAEEDEAADIVHSRENVGAHGDDAVQAHVEQLGEFGQQVHRIEGTAEDCHGHGAQSQTGYGAFFRLADVVDHSGGEHQEAAHHEVCKVPHKGGGGALQQQLQENLDALTGDGGAGSQKEACQQHRNLGEVQLVEGGGQEGQGKVQNMQHRGQGGADTDDADPPGGADLPKLGQQMLNQAGDNSDSRNDGGADKHKAEIVGYILEKRVHNVRSFEKNTP